ncbi:hypothetical protein E2C01_003350 [Portunus trituberculatus]|uniref:Uncharacterized protein n=1 Tax=Portunus trituberculatus TaxID=210409 RepID=A0A5B7CML2_PORTR|nr:hypothetical protein [Portunus trituberculatus]
MYHPVSRGRRAGRRRCSPTLIRPSAPPKRGSATATTPSRPFLTHIQGTRLLYAYSHRLEFRSELIGQKDSNHGGVEGRSVCHAAAATLWTVMYCVQ